MLKLKDTLHPQANACESPGIQPEPYRKSAKAGRRTALFCALAIFLVLLVGSIPAARGSSIIGTSILGARVEPPSGRAGFRLTVDYQWFRTPFDTPPVITCAFMRPDGHWVSIGVIDPSSDIVGVVLTDDIVIRNQSSLDFNVALSDGTIQPGSYTVRCSSGLMSAYKTTFTVVEDEPAGPTSQSGPEAVQTPAAEAPLHVYHLQLEMVRDSSDGVINAKWGGNLKVNLDGSVREKVKGSFVSDGPIRANGKLIGNVSVTVEFSVDVAGTAEVTPNGITMRLMQTSAEFKVLKPAATFMEQNSQEGIEAFQVYYLKLMEEAVPAVLDQILRGLEFDNAALPATQDVSVGIWKGTVVLSVVK